MLLYAMLHCIIVYYTISSPPLWRSSPRGAASAWSYIYIYIYIHTYIPISLYIYIHTYIPISLSLSIYIYIYTYMRSAESSWSAPWRRPGDSLLYMFEATSSTFYEHMLCSVSFFRQKRSYYPPGAHCGGGWETSNPGLNVYKLIRHIQVTISISFKILF